MDEARLLSDGQRFDAKLKEHNWNHASLARELFIKNEMYENIINDIEKRLAQIMEDDSKVIKPLEKGQLLIIKMSNIKDIKYAKNILRRSMEMRKPMILTLDDEENNIVIVNKAEQIRIKRDRSKYRRD